MKELQDRMEQFMEECRYVKRLSEHTVRAYAADLKQFSAYLDRMHPDIGRVEKIDRFVIHGYIVRLNQSYAPRTVRRKYAALKSLFYFLEMEEFIGKNPFDKLRLRAKEPQELPAVMSLGEIRKILRAVYTAEIHDNWCVDSSAAQLLRLRDIAILELLFATGLRVQELCNLKWSDLDRERRSVKIHGKGNKERCIYIGNDEVLSALERYAVYRKKAGVQGPYLFFSRFRGKLSPQAVRNLVNKYTQLAGVEKHITPHTFRHTFASLLLEEGVDIRFIQEFLGHSSISTTQIYLHIAPDTARNVLTALHPRRKLSSEDWRYQEIEMPESGKTNSIPSERMWE